jgi:uncharacterized protein (DUF2141 family)
MKIQGNNSISRFIQKSLLQSFLHKLLPQGEIKVQQPLKFIFSAHKTQGRLVCMVLFHLISIAMFSQNPDSQANNTQEFSNLTSGLVTVRIELPRRFTAGTKVFIALHSRDDYNTDREPAYTAIVTPNSQEADTRLVYYTFDQVESGMYVVSGFVDENGDQRLNLNIFGPTEPWDIMGSSRPMLRMPRFDSVAIPLPETRDLLLRLR